MAELPTGIRRDRPPDLESESVEVSDLLLAISAAPSRDPASLFPGAGAAWADFPQVGAAEAASHSRLSRRKVPA